MITNGILFNLINKAVSYQKNTNISRSFLFHSIDVAKNGI